LNLKFIIEADDLVLHIHRCMLQLILRLKVMVLITSSSFLIETFLHLSPFMSPVTISGRRPSTRIWINFPRKQYVSTQFMFYFCFSFRKENLFTKRIWFHYTLYMTVIILFSTSFVIIFLSSYIWYKTKEKFEYITVLGPEQTILIV
jgi:hypothetical protein